MINIGAGEPPIQFFVHQRRAGEQGGREDFEQMIALLVDAVVEDAHLVYANPGDWGIDALVGNLDCGPVRIWQAKYLPNGVKKEHQDEIRKSFASAVKNAQDKNYTIQEWVLCVPSSLDALTKRWWDGWRSRAQALTHIRITLWDETALRRELSKPAARDVRRIYFNPYRERDDDERPRPRSVPVVPDATELADPTAPWQGGDERIIGKHRYLLHADPFELVAADQSSVWREAVADRLTDSPQRVRLRQLRLLRDTESAARRGDELRSQGRLLSEISGRHSLPRLIDLVDEPAATTLVTVQPSGPTWRQAFGPAPTAAPATSYLAAGVLGAAAELTQSLEAMHQRGYSHRAIHPDGVVLTGRSRRAVLVDLGLAGFALTPGEGRAGYQAPEQTQLAGLRTPSGEKPGCGYRAGTSIDIYQLAVLVYRTLTGHRPTLHCPPIRASLPALPPDLDDLLLSCLHSDPGQRPTDLRAVATALRDGRHQCL